MFMAKREEPVDMRDLLKQDEKKDIESAVYEVLKDLNNTNKKDILTELSESDIKLIMRLNMLSQMRKKKIYKDITELFMLLRISKARKSRLEILKAIKNANPESSMKDKMNNFRTLLS